MQIKPSKDCCSGGGDGSKGFRLIVDYTPTHTHMQGDAGESTAAERDSARYQFASIAELLEISMLAILGPLSILFVYMCWPKISWKKNQNMAN